MSNTVTCDGNGTIVQIDGKTIGLHRNVKTGMWHFHCDDPQPGYDKDSSYHSGRIAAAEFRYAVETAMLEQQKRGRK